jgi:hypothetical protein
MKKDNDIFDDFYYGEWEIEYNFFENEDWAELLKFREKSLLSRPTDPLTQLKYAEALNLNHKYQDTIDFLSPLYNMYNDERFGVIEIIDALFGLGKTIDDFKWIKQPIVLGLDESTLKLCTQFFYRKRKSFSIFDIYGFLLLKSDYMAFDEKELLNFLKKHPHIFCFINKNKKFYEVEIKLNRNKK